MMRKPEMTVWHAATLIVLSAAMIAVAYLYVTVNFTRSKVSLFGYRPSTSEIVQSRPAPGDL